ncbi:MAG: hypothetical protein LBM17_08950 [Candidatus Accumulibacter sp.]|nr:hypothetical protein [Accumulibacter sp.]
MTTLSFAGALLFAAHPAHVEAVAWVASRKDLVAASLGLFSLALLAHAMYHGRPWREVLVSAFLFFLACFGKSTTVAYVIFAGVLLCIGDRSREKGAGELAGLLLFFSLAALVSFIHIRVGADTGVHVENYPGVFAMVERASRILTALTGILLFPYPMRLYYDVYQYGAWHWLVSGGVVASGLVALHILMKQRSLSALGVVLMLSPTLIYLQFIPFSTWSMASERFVFISVAGLSLLVIDFLGRFEKLRTVCVVLAALIIPCAVVTSLRIGEWGSDGIYDMYDIERKHQPNFHVTVFDRIFPRLVMAKRYEEAKTLAQGLGRPYIVDAMLRYLDAHEAYTPFRKLSPSEAMKPELKNLRENFCEKSGKLHESTQKGREQQRVEHDISFYYTMNVIASMSEAYDDLGYEKLSCKPGNN